MRQTLFFLVFAFFSPVLSAQNQVFYTLDDLMDAYGRDLGEIEISTQEVGSGLYVLFGSGGNILASIGAQGTLIVDSMYAPLIPKVQQTLSELGGNGVNFTINSHFHYDHAGGNNLLAESGSWIITHSNSRRSMADAHLIDQVRVGMGYMQPAVSKDAMPVITYDDHMQFHFNGETIDLLHFGPAHTTGDTAIYFRNSNIVHMGDVFNASYPFIDVGNGGDIDGVINFCKGVLEVIERDTAILPGHGPVMNYQDMADYISMLETVRDRIGLMIDAGYTLDEVIDAAPTSDFDERYGNPLRLINRSYMSLSR